MYRRWYPVNSAPSKSASSKYPPAFGIDLHVDDSEGVGMEGKQHRFRVIVVSPADPEWTTRILDGIQAISHS